MNSYLKFVDNFRLDLRSVSGIKDEFQPQDSGYFLSNGESLLVTMAATHSGKIINNRMYLPDKVRLGTPTFVAPFEKPVLIHHDDFQDPIGRIVKAEYIDTSGVIKKIAVIDSAAKLDDDNFKKFINGDMPFKDQVNIICDLYNSKVMDSDEYTGLGYALIQMNITNKDAIQKFLDKRYLTGSVGATTNEAICSICKQNWLADGMCEHFPGEDYDGQICFIICGDLKYREYSMVNDPADSQSQVLEIVRNGSSETVKFGNCKDCLVCSVSAKLVDNAEDGMKGKKKNLRDEEQGVKGIEGPGDLEGTENTGRGESEPAQEGGETEDTGEPEGKPESDENEGLGDTSGKEDPKGEESDVSEGEPEGDGEEGGEEGGGEGELTVTGVISKLFEGDNPEISEEEREFLYEKMASDFQVESEGNMEDGPDAPLDADGNVDWEQLKIEMEKYADGLEGEDEKLKDAKKKNPKGRSGGSNAGKYSKSEGPFCGPSGGAPKGTYPVGTRKRARAALSYARHAPNPDGIRKCVCRHWPDLPSCKKKKK